MDFTAFDNVFDDSFDPKFLYHTVLSEGNKVA